MHVLRKICFIILFNILVAKDFQNTYSIQHILECETYLMEQLNFSLSTFHPYKPLQLYIETLKFETDNTFTQSAWNFVNDSYYSDVCLQFSPHLVALAAMYMSHHFSLHKSETEENVKLFKERDEKLRKWFDGLNVQMKEIGMITNQILDLYKTLQELRTGELLGDALLKITKMRLTNAWSMPPIQQQSIPMAPRNGPSAQQSMHAQQQYSGGAPSSQQNGSHRY